MSWASIYIEAWLNAWHMVSTVVNVVHNFVATWWWSATFVLPLLLWLWENTWKSVTHGRGDARPAIETGLAATSFAYLFYHAVVCGHIWDAAAMWTVVKGPVLRLCMARYIYRGVKEPARSAAGRTFHLWVIIFLAFLTEWNTQAVSHGVSPTRMQQRLDEARHVGLITDEARFVPLFIMLMLFDAVDVVTNAYVQWVVPWIYARTSKSLSTSPDTRVDLTFAAWCFVVMRWSWLLVRVLVFGLLTLASQYISRGMVTYIVFGLVTLGQLSMWWDLRLLAPHVIHRAWLKRTAKRLRMFQQHYAPFQGQQQRQRQRQRRRPDARRAGQYFPRHEEGYDYHQQQQQRQQYQASLHHIKHD